MSFDDPFKGLVFQLLFNTYSRNAATAQSSNYGKLDVAHSGVA
jgi:hypothetical protein